MQSNKNPNNRLKNILKGWINFWKIGDVEQRIRFLAQLKPELKILCGKDLHKHRGNGDYNNRD